MRACATTDLHASFHGDRHMALGALQCLIRQAAVLVAEPHRDARRRWRPLPAVRQHLLSTSVLACSSCCCVDKNKLEREEPR